MIEKTSPLGRGVNALFSKIKSNSFAYIDINIISLTHINLEQILVIQN